MERDQMFATVKWLDMTKNPLFVLLPADLYRSVAEGWGLPKVPKLAEAKTTTVAPTTTVSTTLAKVQTPRAGQTTAAPKLTTIPPTIPPTVAPTSDGGVEVVNEPVTAAPEPPSTRKRVTTTQSKRAGN